MAQLQQQGTFLIDLKPDPVENTPLNSYVPELVHRVSGLSPERAQCLLGGKLGNEVRSTVERRRDGAPRFFSLSSTGQLDNCLSEA